MNKLIQCIFLFFMCINIFGQEVLFQEGKELHRQGLLESACLKFEQFLKEYPNVPDAHKATFSLGEIYYELQQYDQAIDYFKKEIESGISDFDSTVIKKWSWNPSVYYKNRACNYLVEIYLQQQKFDQALEYLELSDQYPNIQECNMGMCQGIFKASSSLKIYIGLGQPKQALKKSLPFLFTCYNADSRWNSFFTEDVLEVLEKHYSMDSLFVEFEESYKNFYYEEETISIEKLEKAIDEFNEICYHTKLKIEDIPKVNSGYYIDFLDVKIQLHFIDVIIYKTTKEGVEKGIKKTLFYQQLKEMALK